jgi:hypothetical protein
MSNAGASQWIQERTAILASSANSPELSRAAMELAASDDPAALDALALFLHDPAFLARLDDLGDPGRKTQNLGQVLMALQQRPCPEIVPLCLGLVNAPDFLSDPDRKIFLLEALAAVAPMNAETAKVFRAANEEGYYAANGRMLAANSSPLALALLLEMMLDARVEANTRIGILHMSLIPVRNRIPVLEFVGRLASGNPEPEIANSAIESIYDFQVHWRKGHPPPPPPWRTSSNETLQCLIDLAAHLKGQVSLPESIHAAMDRTTGIASALLARRAG